jgi:hypothetical protein
MSRPQVADGGDNLQIWGVVVNILLYLVTTCQKGPRTWEDYLDKRPKLRKVGMRFFT